LARVIQRNEHFVQETLSLPGVRRSLRGRMGGLFCRESSPKTTPPQPYLNPNRVKRDGLAFLGLKLSQTTEAGHSESITSQQQFDFSCLCDRNYEYILSTNDDGFLVGGGEPYDSCKISNADSAHVEICRLGTFDIRSGGIDLDTLDWAINQRAILVPKIAIVPTAVCLNGDNPPELETRFDFKCQYDQAVPVELWPNWQLEFLQNQIYFALSFPARFTPGPFHMTCARKVVFRDETKKQMFLKNCEKKLLNGEPQVLGEGICASPEDGGVYLFKDRNNPLHYFSPNFRGPYNTDEKRAVLLKVLSYKWDERLLQWTRRFEPTPSEISDAAHIIVPPLNLPLSDVPIPTTHYPTTIPCSNGSVIFPSENQFHKLPSSGFDDILLSSDDDCLRRQLDLETDSEGDEKDEFDSPRSYRPGRRKGRKSLYRRRF